jgi:tetratricopeptide (TPR) repeat protein
MDAVDLGTENDERMARLREALALGDGFQLVIIQVEPGEQRAEVLRRLAGWSERNAVPRLDLVRLAPRQSPVMRLAGAHAGVILVGLEAEREDKDERTREVIAELNWSRDRLPELVHGPLVLVVSQRVQTALFEQAPDFYSWRAHSTSIAPPQYRVRRAFPWYDGDPADPAALEEMIIAAKLLRPPANLEIARLQERLAFAHAVRGELRESESVLDAAYDGYVRTGTTDDRVELLLLRYSIDVAYRRFDQASAWLECARQEVASGAPSPLVAARLLSAGARLSIHRGALSSAETELERAAVAVRALGDDRELARLMFTQALLASRRGEMEAGDRLLERTWDLYARARDPLGEASTLMALANAAVAAGRSDDAERHGAASVERAHASGSVDMVARARATLGEIALANGHLELAGEVLGHEVAAIDPAARGELAEARGHLALRTGELPAAQRFLRTALEAYQRRSASWSAANVALDLGTLGRHTRDWKLARTGFETAHRFGDARQRALATFGLAGLAYDQGERTVELADQFALAVQMLVSDGNLTLADTARARRGAVLLALDRDADARVELEEAVAGFESRGQAASASLAREVLAQLDHRDQAK